MVVVWIYTLVAVAERLPAPARGTRLSLMGASGCPRAERMNPDTLLDDIVCRILSVHPGARVVLFGSRATGRHRPDSDVDLVVVVPNLPEHEPRSARIRAALRGVGVGLDLVVLTPEEWTSMRHMRNSVVREAAETGRVLHEAA